jgi:nitrogen fixation protein NifQ
MQPGLCYQSQENCFVPLLAEPLYEREILCQALLDGSPQTPDSHALACMIASRQAGIGAMPARLGLTRKAWAALVKRYFPASAWLCEMPEQGRAFDPARLEEQADLRALFLRHRAGDAPQIEWLADILVAGCMAGDHLWQDLGLWRRADLSALIGRNFPALAAKNDRDMKWKKFFYKQLCLGEGVYVCRAPSCEVCADYAKCFGPEE